MIQNKARTWKQGLKRPVEPPKTQYHAESSDGIPNFEWRAAAAGLKPLAAARPRSAFAFRNTARALAAGSPRQHQV